MKQANFLSPEEVLASTSWAPKSRKALSVSTVRLFCLLPQVQNIVVNNQEFGLSENEPSTPFYYSDFDEILGMACPHMVVGNAPAVMQTILQQGQLTQPIFNFYSSW